MLIKSFTATYFIQLYTVIVLFSLLRARLLEEIGRLIRGGQFSERSLARRLGASQPHIHNVCKGTRLLTIAFADHILVELNIPIEKLISPQDLERIRSRRT